MSKHLRNHRSKLTMYFITRVVVIFAIASVLLQFTVAEDTIEIESAVIQCSTDGGHPTGDEGTVDWKPKPLTSFNKTVVVGPHRPQSDLKEDVENDIDLEVISTPHCQQQVIITVKVTTSGVSESGEATLINLDHLLDEQTLRESRIGQPLAIKIQPGPLFTLYPLNYLYSVNAQVQEQVINYENTAEFVECEDSQETPTCGLERDENGPIPNSRGFCCPCGKGFEDSNQRQLRGGQQCSNDSTAAKGSNPGVGSSPGHHASAHCLRWSKYWYAVHELGAPEVFRQFYVNVYRNQENATTGTRSWVPLGVTAKIDSHNQTRFIQKDPPLSVVFRKVISVSKNGTNKLKPLDQVLLIPKATFPYSNENETSQGGLPAPFRGTIDNTHLVVPKTLMDPSGKTCDRIGVGHDAFKEQASPCTKAQSSCFRNQPFGLWAADSDDKSRRSNVTSTHYRLKNFGTVHLSSPMKYIKETLYLVMEHDSEAAAYIDIELPGDDLEIVKPSYNIQILSVQTDSSYTAGKLIVVVANNEQLPGRFAVHVIQCTDNLPIHESDEEIIGPKRTRTYALNMHYGGKQLSSKGTCSVAIINRFDEIIAVRRVSLSPGDTCVCNTGCGCACTKTMLVCEALAEEHLMSSGLSSNDLAIPEKLVGDEPSAAGPSRIQRWIQYAKKNWRYVVPVTILILLLLGLCKGLIGRCGCPKIGRLGLSYFQGKPRKLSKYYERGYSKMDLIYDEDGNPLDPFTKQPTVQRLSSNQELSLNSVFFLCCPVIMLLNLYHCCCRCCRQRKPGKGRFGGVMGVLPEDSDSDEVTLVDTRNPRSKYNSTQSVNARRQESYHPPTSIMKPKTPAARSYQNVSTNYAGRQEADYSLRPSQSTSSQYDYRRNPFNGQTEYSVRPTTPRYGSWHRRPDTLSATNSKEVVQNPPPKSPAYKSEILYPGNE